MLGLVIALLASGFLTSFIGYYTPGMLLGSALMSVGAGLTTTFHPSTTLGHVIAYQAIFGLGCGFAFQQPYIAVQTGLPSTDVPAAIVFLTFVQFLGNIVLLAASQNVLTNRLASGLTSEIPQVDPAAVLNSGALNLKSIVPAQYLSKVLQIYNEALNSVFRVGLVAACVTVVGALGSEWKSIKKSQKANTAQKTP
jgi:MFS family permease